MMLQKYVLVPVVSEILRWHSIQGTLRPTTTARPRPSPTAFAHHRGMGNGMRSDINAPRLGDFRHGNTISSRWAFIHSPNMVIARLESF